MADTSPEAAALLRLEAASLRGDVVGMAAELTTDSVVVAERCCRSLFVACMNKSNEERGKEARAVAASAGVMRLVLETLRRHGRSEALGVDGWMLVTSLFMDDSGQKARAVERGALELALATLYDTTYPKTAAKALAALLMLSKQPYRARIIELGAAEVRAFVQVTRLLS